MYKYRPISEAKPDDIVEYTGVDISDGFTTERLYIVKAPNDAYGFLIVARDDNGLTINGMAPKYFKLLTTRPGTEAKVGDIVYCIRVSRLSCYRLGDTFIVTDKLAKADDWNSKRIDFVVLVQDTPQPNYQTRNLAFYKRSGLSRKKEEYENICAHCNVRPYYEHRYVKYIFDSGIGADTSYDGWYSHDDGRQEIQPNFKNRTQIAYEDVFPSTGLAITDYIIGIRDSPLEQRLLLKAVLEANGQPIAKYTEVFSRDDNHSRAVRFYQDSWCGTGKTPNITIEDFIAEFNNNADQPHSHIQGTYVHTIVYDNLSTTPTTQKENSMNSLQELITALFGNEKPTTDYDKRPAYLVTVYSIDGSKIATACTTTVEAVKTKIQNTPALWGCKVLTYKLDKELSVTVPVTTTKATTAAEVEVPTVE